MGIITVDKSDHLFWLGRYTERVYTTLKYYFQSADKMIDANPEYYGEFCRKIGSDGVKVNIDFGTILYNKENPHLIKTYKNTVNHIHLSVPNLEYVQKIKEHATLKKVLEKIDYNGYLSIEMKNQNDIEKVQKAVLYLKENF